MAYLAAFLLSTHLIPNNTMISSELLQDKFMNLAQKGMDAYDKSQSNVSKTGGAELNSPDNSPSVYINHEEARTQEHGSVESDLFSNALRLISKNKHEHEQPVDEEAVQRAHEATYNQNNTAGMSANALGNAAALQVLKSFTSGGSGGNNQTQLISLAMAEASKLFDKSGGVASGDKQDAVNGAAMTMVKLLVQSKSSGGTIGGSNSGGLSSLMGLLEAAAQSVIVKPGNLL
ncbi:hypothetical protein DXG01_009966 [Tephrocybe rancida]|nr:hypothetical protein DXG01_009966 [Tephrocybe rancida]